MGRERGSQKKEAEREHSKAGTGFVGGKVMEKRGDKISLHRGDDRIRISANDRLAKCSRTKRGESNRGGRRRGRTGKAEETTIHFRRWETFVGEKG